MPVSLSRSAEGRNALLPPTLIARASLFLLVIGFGAFVTPPVLRGQQKDVIVMKNGDRITGQIKGLDNGILKVDLDYVDGTIPVDWTKVVRIESSNLFIVRLTDGSLHSGKLITPDTGEGSTPQIEVSEDGFTFAIGGGMDIRINRYFSFRPVQIDYVPSMLSNIGPSGLTNKSFRSNLRYSVGFMIHDYEHW